MHVLFIFVRCVEFEEVVVLEIILRESAIPSRCAGEKRDPERFKCFIPSHVGTSRPSRLFS